MSQVTAQSVFGRLVPLSKLCAAGDLKGCSPHQPSEIQAEEHGRVSRGQSY